MAYLLDIWKSFRALPLWVQIWVAGILVPVNSAGLLFLDSFEGQVAAVLGIGAMLANTVLLLVQRGFSKAMALPHIIPWTGLVVWIGFVLASTDGPEGSLRVFLIVLLVVDVVSLGFDYLDMMKWFRGDRAVARP